MTQKKYKTMIFKKSTLIIFTAAVLFPPLFSSVSAAEEKRLKPYYSGDATAYQGKVFACSANMGLVEIFSLEKDGLKKRSSIASPDYEANKFQDCYFETAEDALYLYGTNGNYLYKYNLSNPAKPVKEKRFKDNSWDFFLAFAKAGERMATAGTKGVKIWSGDEVIDRIDVANNQNPYSISISENGSFVFNLEAGALKIYSVEKRREVGEIPLIFEEASHNGRVYNDAAAGLIYAVDETALKVFDFSGKLKKEFKHTSSRGYDVISSATDNNYLYFSDGIGVVKMDKRTFKPVKWAYTTAAGGAGGWAMSVKSVDLNGADNIVVFNNYSIAVLDENLKVKGTYRSARESFAPIESLYLKADKTRAPVGSIISLRGGGFGISEKLEITFAGQKFTANSDGNGRFGIFFKVPAVKAGGNDIKVIGTVSGKSYSLGFQIE